MSWTILALLALLLGLGAYKFTSRPTVEKSVQQLQFDASVTENEKKVIREAIQNQSKTYNGTVQVSVKTTTEPDSPLILNAYLPVTGFYDPRQSIDSAEYADEISHLPEIATVAAGIANEDTTPLFIPASELTDKVKLLKLDGKYYLDSFNRGAVFRQAVLTGGGAEALADLKLSNLPGKNTTLKVNMTGVTALTRVLMKKLNSVKDPEYFSAKIGDFLADADITHVSNEVSFRPGCQYSNTSFCSPPEFIETLKDSGVDLVELTGNHNNDQGSTYNTNSINLYHDLGWHTVGGGLNSTEASRPFVADQKGSKITFIAYNRADGAGSGAIAGSSSAGANLYTEAKAKSDIKNAKSNSEFVIVNIQYAECQAYPDGFVEYPICDGPIGGQQAAFRKMIDLGADMVIGSSAHQPQTYELYKGKPIYYGLGNLYFDQIRWPGTERGIVLTHYFVNGKLAQTRLSPTVYGSDFQTRLMNKGETEYLLNRLNSAR